MTQSPGSGITLLAEKQQKKAKSPSPLRVSSRNINQYKTRKLSTVIADLSNFCGANKQAAAKILLARGVARLFKQKSSLGKFLISLKEETRKLNELLSSMHKPGKKRTQEFQDLKNYYLILGELNATIRLRRQLTQIVELRGMQLPEDEEFKRLLQTRSEDILKSLRGAN